MICLDSTFLIDFFRTESAAVEKFKKIIPPGQVVTTAVNAAELIMGLYDTKGVQEKQITAAESLLSKITVLQLDLAAVMKAAEIKAGLMSKGSLVNDSDVLISAIMLLSGCSTILTRETKDFERISGIRVLTY